MAMVRKGWVNRVAITDSIQANLGPLLCFLNNNSSSVDVYLLMCHLHELTDTLGLLFGGLTPWKQHLRYIKVAFHGIIFPNDLLGLGKCGFRSMAFLTINI